MATYLGGLAAIERYLAYQSRISMFFPPPPREGMAA